MSKKRDDTIKRNAVLLKEIQEAEAEFLKQQQKSIASKLLDEQSNRDTTNESSIKGSRKRAASALHESQINAAKSLKKTNEDHAEMLKITHKSSNKKIKEQKRFIFWMTGGYSVEDEEEE